MTDSEYWTRIENFFKENFTQGETIDLDGMLFIIGVQELGIGKHKYKKDDKLNLIHIAVCKLLEPFGYYKFTGFDKEGWPLYDFLDELPPLKANEQQLLIKKAMIQYFKDEQLLD